MAENITLERWKTAEEKVGEAEVAYRRAHRASADILKQTGVLKVEREGREFQPESGWIKERPGIKALSPEEVLDRAKSKRVANSALSSEQIYAQQARELLGDEQSPERALVGLQKEEFITALREDRVITIARNKLLDEEVEILKGIKEEPSSSEQDALDEVKKELKALNNQRDELLKKSPEAYYGLNLKQLKEYKRKLQFGELVETPYVKDKAENIAVHFRAGKPVLIFGHLGSGKTELAMHIAKKYIGKEALVISGSKHTALAELYGHQVLTLDKIDLNELESFTKGIEERFKNWETENADRLSHLDPVEREADKNRAHDRYLQVALKQLGSGTISDYFLGPIYRAMAEGRPVIIDEVNAIPHEVLISLNHILTRKVGDEINVQQDSGKTIRIKEGYGVMMTGNLNQGDERYIDREDMDPAFLSRLHKVEYDYLPQQTEGKLDDSAGAENELFTLMVAKVMDSNGNIDAPKDTLEKLWNLAKAARISQDVFSGKEVDSAYYRQEGGSRAVPYLLQETVMSIRAIMNILNQWQKEGRKHELDYYVWSEFVGQSTVAADSAYLYQILKDRFGFFALGVEFTMAQDATGQIQTITHANWPQNPNYGTGGVVRSFSIDAPKKDAAERKFFGPREVVNATYGKGPERTRWPEKAVEEEKGPELSPELLELMDFQQKLESEIMPEVNIEVSSYLGISIEELLRKNADSQNEANQKTPGQQ